jgi:hypothetical protein
MSWLYSRALVEASSVDISLDGAPCALWSGTHMQRASWLPAKTTAASRLSRSGMTYKALTDDPGEAVLTWCLEDSHVPTSLPQGTAKGSTARLPGFGRSSQESSVKFDRHTFSWRTVDSLFNEDLPESSVTLPAWGTMQDGVVFRQPTSEHLITEKGFSSMREQFRATRQPALKTTGPAHGAASPSFQGAIARMANGNAETAESGHTHFIMKNGTVVRSAAPSMWLTPLANEDAAGTPNGKMQKMLGNHPLIRGTTPEEWSSGTLSPMWVEWLMGFPIGWTGLDALETPRFQQWLLSHGVSLEVHDQEEV